MKITEAIRNVYAKMAMVRSDYHSTNLTLDGTNIPDSYVKNRMLYVIFVVSGNGLVYQCRTTPITRIVVC